MRISRRQALVLALTLLAASPYPSPANAEPGGPLIFAAASLKNALDDAAAAWTSSGKPAPRISYAGSPALARQIEQGAPADIFISADTDWMDYLAKRSLIRPGTRTDLLGNAIVIVAPAASAASLPAVTADALSRALGGGRLAVADVKSVPAGKYAKTALEKLGAWDALKHRLAQSENVRAALLFVARGEAPLGIVYRTDAAAEPKVKIVAALPRDSHPPVIYPAAVTSAARSPYSSEFLAFLRSAQARPAFEKQGFTTLDAVSK
ncbi:MAG: molybdate ABC transporter substrate-binding protein [Beijerinckiaceae bacterium]